MIARDAAESADNNINGDVLRFELEGAFDDSWKIRLDALEIFLDQVQRTLYAVEREISGRIRTNTVYTLAEVSLRRRLRLGVKGRQEKDLIPYVGHAVFPRLKSEALDIARGVEPPGIDTDTLETFAGFEATRKKGLNTIKLLGGPKPISIDNKFDTSVQKLLGNIYTSAGTFRGRLEAVNLHTNPSSAYIYPVAGPSKVRCTFVKGRFANIGDFLEKYIEVYGVLKFREDEPHPFAIDAQEIRLLGDSLLMPNTSNLLGLMPNLTVGKDVMEYLQELRNEPAA